MSLIRRLKNLKAYHKPQKCQKLNDRSLPAQLKRKLNSDTKGEKKEKDRLNEFHLTFSSLRLINNIVEWVRKEIVANLPHLITCLNNSLKRDSKIQTNKCTEWNKALKPSHTKIMNRVIKEAPYRFSTLVNETSTCKSTYSRMSPSFQKAYSHSWTK